MSFSLTFTAGPEHIDRMCHVNNAVRVQWMETLATGSAGRARFLPYPSNSATGA